MRKQTEKYKIKNVFKKLINKLPQISEMQLEKPVTLKLGYQYTIITIEYYEVRIVIQKHKTKRYNIAESNTCNSFAYATLIKKK